MWTPTTRQHHSRDHLRYGSDLTDAEWEMIAPLMPPPAKTGRPRAWSMREIINAIFYVLRGWLCLAHAAEVLSADDDGLWLVPALSPGRPIRDDQPPPDYGRSGAGRGEKPPLRRR